MRLLVPLPFDIACQEHGRNLRVAHLLRELSARCRITIAASDSSIATGAAALLPNMTVTSLPHAADRAWGSAATLRGSWWVRRAAEFFGYDPAFHAWTDRLSDDADVVLGFDLASAFYLAGLGRNTGGRTRTVCDVIDDPWLTFRSGRLDEQISTLGLKTVVAVRTVRRQLLTQIDTLLAVAPRDAETLSRATGRPVRVVPNGVELPADYPATAARSRLVVFTGAMSFPPNEQAAQYLAREIWPRVRRVVPEARLALVGADPTACVRDLEKEPGVSVTGRVQSMQAWLRRARVATAPMLSGTGLKNKVLEAAAQGCPVVATRLGAGGISGGDDEGIAIADDPSEFAAAVVRLLTDADTAERAGRAAATLVRERFSWPGAAARLWSVLQDQLGKTRCNENRSVGGCALHREPCVGREDVAHAAS